MGKGGGEAVGTAGDGDEVNLAASLVSVNTLCQKRMIDNIFWHKRRDKRKIDKISFFIIRYFFIFLYVKKQIIILFIS
jgi:hypothetical protein